jgi:hypothetical protein
MKLRNGSWLETLTHKLYKEWENSFEILKDKGSILRSYSGWSNLKEVIVEITGAQSNHCRMGFDNGISIAYRMCPPIELMEYYQMDPAKAPIHFMRGTATEVWGNGYFKTMRSSAADWNRKNCIDLETSLSFSFLFFCCYFTTAQ